jgi:hypothetical protein
MIAAATLLIGFFVICFLFDDFDPPNYWLHS